MTSHLSTAVFERVVGLPPVEVKKKGFDLEKMFGPRGDKSFPAELRDSRLSQADYDDCLGRWKVWLSVYTVNGVWRNNFICRLNSESAQWQQVMCLGTRKLKEEEREMILYRFKDQAGADPLNYLNFCGMPPLDLLSILDDTDVRLRKIKSVAGNVRENEKQTLRDFERLKKRLSKYERDDNLKKKTADFESALLETLAAEAASVGLKERSSRTKRRVHTENEFAYVVNQLVAESYSNMTSMTLGEWHAWYQEQKRNGIENPDWRTMHSRHWVKSILPAITCLLNAAFPEWFKSNDIENALRKVKACWPKRLESRKKQVKIYLPEYPTCFSADRSLVFLRSVIKFEPPVR